MRERFLNDLEPILSAIPSPHEGEPDPATQLQHWLYQECFCKSLAGSEVVPAGTTANLLAELSKANTGRDCWDAGWEITHVNGAGRVTARRQDVTRAFWPGQFLTEEGPELPPQPGMHLKVFFPKESATMQPGFYFAFGNSPEEDFDPKCIVRFYWAVRSSGAAFLVGDLTGAFNRLRVPFRFKTGVEAHSYGRLDAAVLYVHKRFYQISARLLAPVYQRIRGHLTSGAPLFTKELAPGLGLAEDPGTGESFGMQRCRLLAGAILAAGSPTVDRVVEQLELAGVRADRPYLSAGSVDHYQFPPYDEMP